MTVSATDNRVEQNGDGVSTDVPVPYFILASDLVVTVDGVLQTITTDYTVTGAGNENGGTVSFVTAPANGTKIVVRNIPPNSQLADFVNNVTILEENIERALDKLTFLVQAAQDDIAQRMAKNTLVSTPEWDAESLVIRNVLADPNDPTAAATSAELDTKVSEAETFATNASNSASAAASSASAASDDADAAAASASAASASETNAAASETKASEWADKAEDDPVETSPDRFSAKHWALQAQAATNVTAAGVPFDDTGNTHVTGADVQAALDAADTELVALNAALPSTASEGAQGLIEQATDAEIKSAASGAKGIMAQDLSTAAAPTTTLSDAANISFNWAGFINDAVTLGGNRTLDNPTNVIPGTWRYIDFVQDGTGSRTLSFGTNYEFAGGTAPTLTTTANARDRLAFYARTSTAIEVYEVGLDIQ